MRARRERGVTLIELMVAGVLVGIVAGIVFKVMVTGSALFSAQSRIAEAQVAARFGANMIAMDAATAGYGTTSNCSKDTRVLDPASSCDQFLWPNQAVFFVDAAYTDAHSPQFQPDELWIMTNPYPGQRLSVEVMDGNVLEMRQVTDSDAAMMRQILTSKMLMIEQRGTRSFRKGIPTASLTEGAGADSLWALEVDPLPASNDARGYAGADMTVSAMAWIRYSLQPDEEDPTGHKIDLIRSFFALPGEDPTSSDIIAEDDVIDFQVTFCMDTSYDATSSAAITPTVVCGIHDANMVNDAPEQVRNATITLRARDKSEDSNFYADPDHILQWYDVDGPGHTADGVAHVRTMTRTFTFANLGVR